MNERFLPLENGASKIIKAKNQRTNLFASGVLRKHQILDAEEKARLILNRARENADDLIVQAESEAEAIRRAAYESGRGAAEKEFLENLLAIADERSRALLSVEQDVLKLAVKLAEKIIGRELESDKNVRAEIVFNALRQARQQEMLTVRVNAADLPTLEKMSDQLNHSGRTRIIDFVADQAVAEGGCIIESQSGTIDARLETQLRILENALLARTTDDTRED